MANIFGRRQVQTSFFLFQLFEFLGRCAASSSDMSTSIVLNQNEKEESVGSILIMPLSDSEVDLDISGQDGFLELSLTLETDKTINSKITRTSTFDYKGLPQPILIDEDTTGGCGGKTWQAADVMCNYLIWKYESSNGSAFIGKNVLELGSGTGLVGLALGAMCNPNDAKEIIITDQLWVANSTKNINVKSGNFICNKLFLNNRKFF